MLFGRAPAKENIKLTELEAYLNLCFDAKLKRLAVRMPEIEAGLAKSFTGFEKAMQEFSRSTSAPDMEYLYSLKETYLKSQKENYSGSVLNLLSSPPEYSGNYLYLRAKTALQSYSSFITSVMKVNNTFRLVMIGYAAGLTETKHQFTTMERLCKELDNELKLCLLEEEEYRRLRSKTDALLENVSEIASSGRSPDHDPPEGSSDESALGPLQKRIKEKEAQVELARRNHREADSILANLLLPVERAARKHDHMSTAKRRLTEYMKDATEWIRTTDDATIIQRHLDEIAEEVRTGKIDAKNPEGLILQVDAVRKADLLALADSARKAAIELKNAETELTDLQSQMQAMEKHKEEREKKAAEKTRTEHEISQKRAHLSAEKKELERLFLNCYKKQVEIALP